MTPENGPLLTLLLWSLRQKASQNFVSSFFPHSYLLPLTFNHIKMADEQVPVHYEDLALLETKFDEVDRQICIQFSLYHSY